MKTRGRTALNRYLGRPDQSQAKLATAVGVKQPSVSMWARGLSRPEPPLRTALQIVAGIPEDDWLTDQERAAIDAARARAATPPDEPVPGAA